jgi:hypothetical protein
MTDFPNLHPEEGGAKINNIYDDISPQALGQLVDYITQSGIPIPISQVIGFTTFTVQAAPQINADESTSSTSYVDLATVGPQLRVWGAQIRSRCTSQGWSGGRICAPHAPDYGRRGRGGSFRGRHRLSVSTTESSCRRLVRRPFASHARANIRERGRLALWFQLRGSGGASSWLRRM